MDFWPNDLHHDQEPQQGVSRILRQSREPQKGLSRIPRQGPVRVRQMPKGILYVWHQGQVLVDNFVWHQGRFLDKTVWRQVRIF